MKWLYLCNLFIAMFCFCYASVAQDTMMIRIEKGCMKKYGGLFEVVKRVNLTSKDTTSSIFLKNFGDKGFYSASIFFFASKKKIGENLKSRFSVMIFKYESNGSAAAKFNMLENVKVIQDESVFGKDWNWAGLHDNYILRLKAGCLFSETDWVKLKTDFLTTIGGFTTGSRTINCKCGGSCK